MGRMHYHKLCLITRNAVNYKLAAIANLKLMIYANLSVNAFLAIRINNFTSSHVLAWRWRMA